MTVQTTDKIKKKSSCSGVMRTLMACTSRFFFNFQD